MGLVRHQLHRPRAGLVEFLYWLFGGFAVAIVVALRGIRSVISVLALLFALPSFVLLFIMHFG
jgi:hypothetical protein